MAKKPSLGYRAIAARLREEMLAAWKPGRKLPTYAELGKRFATTPVTMQRAMDLLVEQGFVVTRPTVGSFYAELPPEQCQVGLVFPGHPAEIVHFGWSLNYLASLTVAKAINEQQGRWRFRFYMDVSQEVGSRGLAKLNRDIADRVLGGLIWNYSPHDLKATALLTNPPLPMVHYNPDFMLEAPALRLRNIPRKPFMESSLQWMQNREINDIAVLAAQHLDREKIMATFTQLGLVCRPEWVLPMDVYRLDWVGNLISALFRDDGRRRPQALIINDDHLVEPAVNALLELNPPGLDRLAIFGHWNFPLPYRGRLPITRYGYDAQGWLSTALEMIAACPTVAQVANHPERAVDFRLVEETTEGDIPSPTFTHLIHQAKKELQCVTM